tara:strand:+ start:70036 stop:70410 length:375 start_codon:yes stop_codon:yes gene_type:complete
MKILKLSMLFLLISLSSCAQTEQKNNKKSDENVKVTFIELGSVKCIPCQKMQSVIKQVEEKYPTQVATIFYDVWTDEGKEASKAFEFDLIPTQVFLDENGNEYYRHEGYFEFDELEKILQQKLK